MCQMLVVTSQLRDDEDAGDDGITQPLVGSTEKSGASAETGEPREGALLRQE